MQVVDTVPTHLWHLVGVLRGLETLNVQWEDAQAVRIALFAMTAHQLLAYADTHNWLAKVAYYFVQPMLAKVRHSCTCFALSREKHAVGLGQ